MTTDGAQENFPSSPARLRTEELVFEGKNLDHVTDYPYETPDSRKVLIKVLEEAIRDGKTVFFVDGDIDELKRLNALCGHTKANDGIKQFVTDKEQALMQIVGAESVFVYRHQAGGDEFKAVVVLSQNTEVETAKQDIEIALGKAVNFKYGDNDDDRIDLFCTSGISIRNKNQNGKEPAEELHLLEAEAEKQYALAKTAKIDAEIQNIVQKGQSLSPHKYWDFVIQELGAKRITPQILTVIGYQLIAKMTAQHIGK